MRLRPCADRAQMAARSDQITAARGAPFRPQMRGKKHTAAESHQHRRRTGCLAKQTGSCRPVACSNRSVSSRDTCGAPKGRLTDTCGLTSSGGSGAARGCSTAAGLRPAVASALPTAKRRSKRAGGRRRRTVSGWPQCAARRRHVAPLARGIEFPVFQPTRPLSAG